MGFAVKVVVCLSTQFGHPGDGYGGRTATVLTNKPVQPSDIGIAHRYWPMGSVVSVTNIRTGKTSLAIVMDRGPYGKTDAQGNWFNARKERDRVGQYRGCADLTPRLAEIIGHNKKEKVRLRLLWAPTKRG